jgi:xylulokinase
LLEGTPVAVGSGDSVVEAFGIGAAEPGACVVKLGTAANVNLVTATPCPSPRAITYRHVVDRAWFTITATNSGASTMRWFRDAFCRLEVQEAQAEGISVYTLIDRLAAGASPGADGLIFHPYLMGERSPYWNPQLRGDFTGISARHGREHFARAVLEGVAYSIRDCLEVVEALGQPIEGYHLIGGGAKSKLWRQILCDVLGKPLNKPQIEGAAFGAAVIAGVAVGVFEDWRHAVETCVRIEETLHPNPGHHALHNAYFAVYQDMVDDLANHTARLNQLADQQEQLRSRT